MPADDEGHGPRAAFAWETAIRRGDYASAWAINDVVLRSRTGTPDDPRLPYHLRFVWDGREFAGRDVLVRCYHGLGDTLQFARYLPALARVARSVTVEAQPALLPILRAVPGVHRFVPFRIDAPMPPAECDIEIMELAHALRLRPEAVPPPYLFAPAELLAQARARLGLADERPKPSCPRKRASIRRCDQARGMDSRLRGNDGDRSGGDRSSSMSAGRPVIGVCCRAGDWDAGRSVPIADLGAALAGCGASLVRLHQEAGNAGGWEPAWANPGDRLDDIAMTAALVGVADLVITVDTMIAHLAGAMGRRVWLLLKHAADWRWMDGRSDSPWYLTMRLFRQATPGDWSDPLEAVDRELAALPGFGHPDGKQQRDHVSSTEP